MTPPVLVTANGLEKAFSSTLLFKSLSLTLHEGDHLGLIGPNGSGKSTFLKILSGLETADAGDLSLSSGIRVAYLPQIDDYPAKQSIREILLSNLPDHLADWEIQKWINDLQEQAQFSDLDLPFGSLSGGWKKRVAISAVLARGCDLVLLDEPTNHLDLAGILWLEDLLQSARFAFILISHDRFFLENTCESIMDLDRRYKQGFLKVRGNYSSFLQEREKYLNHQQVAELALSNKVRREIEWLRRGPKARTTKANYRIDKAHEMIAELSELQQRNNLQTEAGIRFDASERRSKKLLYAKGLRLTRGGKTLFKDLELFLSPGMRIGIMGANGSGKSSLVQVLQGLLTPDAGSLELAQGVRLISLDQSRQLPDEQVSLRRALSPEGDTLIYQGNAVHVSTWANRFLFQKDQLDLPVSQLSGGERARVLIAELMRQTAEILILDEPTNDLDIPTLEVLEESLNEFKGAQLLITHDRYLMDRVCDQILYLVGDGSVKFFADTQQLTQFQRSRIPETVSEKEVKPVTAGQKQRHQQLRSLKKDFARVERDIEKAEVQRATLDAQLHDPGHATDPGKLAELQLSLEDLDERLLELLELWEKLGTELTSLE